MSKERSSKSLLNTDGELKKKKEEDEKDINTEVAAKETTEDEADETVETAVDNVNDDEQKNVSELQLSKEEESIPKMAAPQPGTSSRMDYSRSVTEVTQTGSKVSKTTYSIQQGNPSDLPDTNAPPIVEYFDGQMQEAAGVKKQVHALKRMANPKAEVPRMLRAGVSIIKKSTDEIQKLKREINNYDKEDAAEEFGNEEHTFAPLPGSPNRDETIPTLSQPLPGCSSNMNYSQTVSEKTQHGTKVTSTTCNVQQVNPTNEVLNPDESPLVEFFGGQEQAVEGYKKKTHAMKRMANPEVEVPRMIREGGKLFIKTKEEVKKLKKEEKDKDDKDKSDKDKDKK